MMKFMTVLIFAITILPWQLAIANDSAIPQVYEISVEQSPSAIAGGIRFKSDFSEEPYITLGSSFNSISSKTKALAQANRKTIFPVYIFVQLKPKLLINPFFEAGVDVGDFLKRHVAQSNNDHTNREPAEPVDTYFALGLEFIHNHFGFSLYYKEYDLEYWQTITSTTYIKQINILKMMGLSASYNY